MKQQLAVIILAAGKGSRMKSDLPKALHAVGGKEMLSHVMDTAQRTLQPERMLVVYSHDEVKKLVETKNIGQKRQAELVLQAEQKGTGHAILVCQEALANFKGTVVVLFSDAPLIPPFALQQLVAVHAEQENKLTTITAMTETPKTLGRILRDEHGHFLGTVEVKDATPDQLDIQEVATAIFAVEAKNLFAWLEQVSPSPATGEIYLNGIEKQALAEGARVGTITSPEAFTLVGCNTPEDLVAAEAYLQQHKSEAIAI